MTSLGSIFPILPLEERLALCLCESEEKHQNLFRPSERLISCVLNASVLGSGVNILRVFEHCQ